MKIPPQRIIVGPRIFASTRAIVAAACYGPTPCHPQATITSGGTVIATTKPEHVGAEELANIYFKLSSAGKAMLRHASGNQLGAAVKLTNGSDTATGQIALVGYR